MQCVGIVDSQAARLRLHHVYAGVYAPRARTHEVQVMRAPRRSVPHPSDLSGKAARAVSISYYEYIDREPKPSIAVIQDLDGNDGYGYLWGEVNSNIHKGFGCQSVITDGGVRDVPDIAPGFQMLAASVLPSHAFVRGGLRKACGRGKVRVTDGDIIHADQHGAVVIPADLIGQIEQQR